MIYQDVLKADAELRRRLPVYSDVELSEILEVADAVLNGINERLKMMSEETNAFHKASKALRCNERSVRSIRQEINDRKVVNRQIVESALRIELRDCEETSAQRLILVKHSRQAQENITKERNEALKREKKLELDVLALRMAIVEHCSKRKQDAIYLRSENILQSFQNPIELPND